MDPEEQKRRLQDELDRLTERQIGLARAAREDDDSLVLLRAASNRRREILRALMVLEAQNSNHKRLEV